MRPPQNINNQLNFMLHPNWHLKYFSATCYHWCFL